MNRRDMLLGAAGATLAAGAARAQTPSGPSPAELAAEERLHKDWPWLARYRDANAADATLPPERRRVVFLGDSITQGWFDKRPAFFTEHGFIGRGIGGQVTAQMLVRFWPDVVALKPAAVHLMAGTNDIAGNAGPYDPAATQANVEAMATLARASGIKLALASITPAVTYPWRPQMRPDLEIPKLNAWLKDFARRTGALYVDYDPVLNDGRAGMKPGLAYDQVHPTEAGYVVMEPVALAALAGL